VVVGDSKTFGKGTVQQMIELSKAVPALANGGQAGAVKLTIQKFYRIAGGSTQLRGVESDITLPSTSDQPEMGESALKDPLPYDTIKPLVYDKWTNPIFLEELRQRSQERIPKDPEFAYVLEDLSRIRKYVDENKLSTNEKIRKEEIEKDKARNKKREEERAARVKGAEPKAFRITLDNVAKAELLPVTFVEPKTPKEGEPEEEQPKEPLNENGEETVYKAPPIRYDPVKAEGLNILGDFVELSKGSTVKAAAK
jgi:carboxyl-terminal processing protease